MEQKIDRKFELFLLCLAGIGSMCCSYKYIRSPAQPRWDFYNKGEDVRKLISSPAFPSPIPREKYRNVFYNRIEKCGSRSVISLAIHIAQRNKFHIVSDKVFKRSLDSKDLISLQRNITGLLPPTLFVRHAFFVDLHKYPESKPIYMNILRDPIERFQSHYNYVKYGDVGRKKPPSKPNRPNINDCVMKEITVCHRASTMMFNMGRYLCGMGPICNTVSRERVEIAKKHIDEEYSFIGMADEFNQTILLLEWMLPSYFRGASTIWNLNKGIQQKTKTKKREYLSQKSKEKLRNYIMKDEYEVYYHAKRKFQRLKEMYNIS